MKLEISADKDSDKAIALLSSVINEMFTDEKISIGDEAIISTARQNASLSRALEFINCAIEAYSAGISTDAASSDIELSLGAIAELDGKAVSEEVVAGIFSKFCVGK